jgi:hypothetical protein
MAKAMTHEIKALAVQQGFHAWAGRDPMCKKIYKRLPKETMEVINDSLSEMDNYKPNSFELWWALNHMRYIKRFKQADLKRIWEIMMKFLTKYIRGELHKFEEKKKKPVKRASKSKG